MDPQATWDQLLCAFREGDWDVIEERATDLIEWLDRGGFPPKDLAHPGLGPDWDRALARAGCELADRHALGRACRRPQQCRRLLDGLVSPLRLRAHPVLSPRAPRAAA